MKVLVCGAEQRLREIKEDLQSLDDVVFAAQWDDVKEKGAFNAFFILDDLEGKIMQFEDSRPVFINQVISTLHDLNAPGNIIRINGWAGFLKRNIWEAAGPVGQEARHAAAILGKKLVQVKDIPGLIAATVISMIINEAFFALKEGLSTKEEINIAMKSATNYPYGPFEWGEKIGFKNVHNLLERLSKDDERYLPAFTPDQT